MPAFSVVLAFAIAVVALARHLMHRRAFAAWRRRLARGDVDMPLSVGHLSPALARLTVQARTLRLMLEIPVCRFATASWRITPWGRRQICDEYDLAIIDARLALWQWIRDVERLSPAERQHLAQLRVDLQPVGRLFTPRGRDTDRRARADAFDRTDALWDSAIWPRHPNLPAVAEIVAPAVEALGRFELALLRPHADPYR